MHVLKHTIFLIILCFLIRTTRMKCDLCDKSFGRSDNYKRHLLTHSDSPKQYPCEACSYETNRKDLLKRHTLAKHLRKLDSLESPPEYPKHYGDQGHVRDGTASTAQRGFEEKLGPGHYMDPNLDSEADSGLNESQVANRLAFEPNIDEEASDSYDGDWNSWKYAADAESVQRLIEQHKQRIRTYAKRSKRWQDVYNFEIKDGSRSELDGFLEKIVADQESRAFKLNVSFGFILRNYLTSELVYYYASKNNRLFQKPVVVKNREDCSKITQAIDKEDLLEYARNQRPNSRWVVISITNAFFYVDKMKHPYVGSCSDQPLPMFLLNSKSLISFDKDKNGLDYKDQLCFYRSLAFHTFATLANVTSNARSLLLHYCNKTGKSFNDFKGVSLEELPALEDIFNVNIEVVSLKEVLRELDNGELVSDTVACKLFSSRLRHPGKTMYLNLYQKHFSYITKIQAFTRQWSCQKCETMFPQLSCLKRHERKCSGQTSYKFPGGGHGPRKNIFEKLREHEITVEHDMCFYPFRLAFDFECMFVDPELEKTDNTEYLNKLDPASVSVMSNVPGYDVPHCIVSSGDPMQLMNDMYSYMTVISDKAYQIMRDKFAKVIDEITEKIDHRQEVLAR